VAKPRKIYLPDYLAPAAADSSLRIQQLGYPSPFRTTTADLAEATGVGAETAARIAADNAEQAARIAADNTLQTHINSEASTRAAADTTLTTNLATETTNRTNADNTLTTNLATETTNRINGDTVAHFATLDFSGLPTADPGGGKVWLKAGNLHVGA
jgi:hypothetical protein